MTGDPYDVIDLDTEPAAYKPDGKTAPRWQPDLQLVPAILATPKWPRELTDYEEPDRCWIIAGVDIAGWSAPEIMHRIGGSKRLVHDIRSKPFTELCKLMQAEVTRLETDLRVERISHTATQKALADEIRVVERLRVQLDQVLDLRIIGERVELCARGKHPMVKYNSYTSGGKTRCRACRREWDLANRRGPRTTATSASLSCESVPQERRCEP